METGDGSGERESGRAKRQKVDKKGRLSAFEKLKQLKGAKRKYEVNDLENVYDTVNEQEYSDRIIQRQEDDWIEDDDGCGYVEDGREIFDDDDHIDNSKSIEIKDKETRAKKRKARVSALTETSSSSSLSTNNKSNLRNMLSNMSNRKKEDVKLDEDNILSDIMSELKSDSPSTIKKTKESSSSTNYRSLNVEEQIKKDTKDYFKKLTVMKSKKPIEPAVTIKIEEDEEEFAIFDVPSPKKNPNKGKIINKNLSIKIEEDDKASQIIEEIDTQNLGDINFDDDSMQEKPASKRESGTSNTVDGLTFDDFADTNLTAHDSATTKQEMFGDWEHGTENNCEIETKSNLASLPLYTNKEGEKVLRFYWWDAWEDKFIKPGVVFLFGKVYVDPLNPSKGSVSCCVVVKNINRRLYLLPREYKLDPCSMEEDSDNPVSMMDIYEEFNKEITPKLGIKTFKSRKVTKNYAFSVQNVPSQSEYMEVKYSATHPAPENNGQYSTFSHIFGTNTSSLELLLLEQKIKGPCWLEIKNPEYVSNKVSWCSIEANCVQPEDINVLRSENLNPPPMVVACVNTRVVVDPKTRISKIVMISCLVNNNFEIHKPAPNTLFNQHFCAFTRVSNEIWPLDLKSVISQYKATKLMKCDSERELLNYFLLQLWKIDPDLLVGHDLSGYQQDLIIGNILDKKIPNWSRLGRLKRTVVPLKKYASKDAFLGRLVCDIKISAMELIKSRSFDLDTLCSNVLKVPEGSRTEVIPDEIYKYYENSQNLLELVNLTMQDASYILKMMCELNVLPLALQITQIAGNVMSRTLMGGRSERNEFLLLHAFTEKEFIVPDKASAKKENLDNKESNEANDGTEATVPKKPTQSRKKPAYSGGLVLDPKKGFYDSLILLMDFNSLYPSIIQEYNICFTTVKMSKSTFTEDDIAELALPDSNIEPGILPTQIRRLVESRREVKKLMKAPDLTPELYMQYNIRQLALKLTANSMYGCLGFTHSRFYAKPLAALVTMKGREILINTKELVQKLNFDVIYGDTDSIMINTNCLDYDQVFKIGYDIKKEINKKYKQVELDIDGVFRYLLLLKKKKYAAVIMSKKNGEFVYTQELKGLDIVRRDWSQLAAEAGKFILNQILSEQNADERIENIQSHLNKLRDDLKDNKMPLSMLIITKQLTKNPNEYADKNTQPHVQVANRLNSKNGRKYKKNDVVPYIICEDGTTNAPMQRAYHIEELKNSENLKVDVNYYLAHQLHPVISRICDPIEGMGSARVADCLGLDPSLYKQTIKRDHFDNNEEFQIENEKEKYIYCQPFSFTCIGDKCQKLNTLKESLTTTESDAVSFLEKCQNEKCSIRPIDYVPTLINQLTKQIRKFVQKYYENWLICEDPACTNRTNKIPCNLFRGYPVCNACTKGVMFREYTERDLYNQLSFFHYLFDINKHTTLKKKLSPQVTSGLFTLKEHVEDILSHSNYSVINLGSLFSIFITEKEQSNETSEDCYIGDVPDYEIEDLADV